VHREAVLDDFFMCEDAQVRRSRHPEVVVPVPLYQAKADLFRTLGHPARIRILELLSEHDHAVHELLAVIEIEPSNLSQQLAVLRRAGLVQQRREAGAVVYSVSVPEVRDLLLAGRGILRQLIDDRDQLKRDLRPAARGRG
jgi:DNA-binding transcriptional ArsR family regulator